MLLVMYKMVAIKLLVAVSMVDLLLWWYSCQHINKYIYILHLVCFHANHIQSFCCILILFILQSVTWGNVAIVTVAKCLYVFINRSVSVIEAEWLLEVAPNYFKQT